jgi:hypothetical protein
MGLMDILRGKKEEVKQVYQKWGKPDPEIKAAEEAAYREARLERAQKEGRAKGLGVQATSASRQTPQRAGGKYNYKLPKGDFFTGGFGGSSGFWGPSEQQQKPAPPMETVKISKSGGVTIHRPIQPQRSMQAQENPYDFWNLSGIPAGATGANRKKNERDYDPILG